jgi:hypothetical protein
MSQLWNIYIYIYIYQNLQISLVRIKQNNFVLEGLRLNKQWEQLQVVFSSLFVNS